MLHAATVAALPALWAITLAGRSWSAPPAIFSAAVTFLPYLYLALAVWAFVAWCVLPDRRGLLIDTPGMRELQLWAQADSARDTFDDIAALAAECHFTDCRHRGEPRCAVTLAVEDGRLSAERLANYQKLQDEMTALESRKNAREQINTKRHFKTASRAMKQLYKSREES